MQRPYRWNLERLHLGLVLDLGCGLGRNLAHLQGVGIDHNPTSVGLCRQRGYEAYTPEEFDSSPRAAPQTFDSLLAAHLVEHMARDDAIALLRRYLPMVRKGGKVVVIAPQSRGYRSDPTHVEYVDFDGLEAIADALDLDIARRYSFPFPWTSVGRWFTYNEFVLVANVPAS